MDEALGSGQPSASRTVSVLAHSRWGELVYAVLLAFGPGFIVVEKSRRRVKIALETGMKIPPNG
jgi:hypothetical protein